MGRAVVLLRRAGCAFVNKLVIDRLPGFASVIGALQQLPEPAAGLGGIEPIRVGRRSFEVIHLPPGEVRAADVPLLAFSIGGQDECALACADQNSYFAHSLLLFDFLAGNLGSSGVGSCCCQRRRVSAKKASRFLIIFRIAASGAAVSSCCAPHNSNSNNSGARSMPFSVSR